MTVFTASEAISLCTNKHFTQSLPKGAQKAMIDAARLADREATPICRLLIIRTSGMRLSGDGGIFRENDAAGSVIDFLNRHASSVGFAGYQS